MVLIALIAPPCGGKTTLAEQMRLTQDLEVITTSVALKQDPEALEYMRKGQLVPPEISHRTLAALIEGKNCFVLDGFPREGANVEYLETRCPMDLYVIINELDETCRQRNAASKDRAKRMDAGVFDQRLVVYRRNLAKLCAALPADRTVTVSSCNAIGIINDILSPLPPPPPLTGEITVGIQSGRSCDDAQMYFTEKKWSDIITRREVAVKPRSGAQLLKEGVIDVLVAPNDCLAYLDNADGLEPVYQFTLQTPNNPISGCKSSRLALVVPNSTEMIPDETELRIVSDYPGADRFFPRAKKITTVAGSAESLLQSMPDKFNAAIVVVETGRSLEHTKNRVGIHLFYLEMNVWVNVWTETGLALFKKFTNRLHTLTRLRCKAPGFITTMLADDSIDFDVDCLTDEDFDKLPLVIKGKSKEVRYLRHGLVVIKLVESVYSFTHNRAAIIEGTARSRLTSSRKLVDVLNHAGVNHAYLQVGQGYILSKMVVPHPSEYAKYDLPLFYPFDLTPEQFDRLPRAPPVEIIIKRFHSGTSKHRYVGMPGMRVRRGKLTANHVIQPEDAYPETLVRFDWRNPLTRIDEDGQVIRVQDEILPEPMADWLIDVKKARRTALRASAAISEALAKVDIVYMDLCLFIDESGTLMYGELGPDCGRFRHYELGSLDKDVWRSGGSSSQVVLKWNLLGQHLAKIVVPVAPVPVWTQKPLRVLLGTTNPFKVAEFAAMFQDMHVDLATTSKDITEPFDTLQANADAKLQGYCSCSELEYDLIIVEDSGIFVDALQGAPGVHSARYSGAEGDRSVRDPANNAKLLKSLEGTKNRAAHMRIVIAATVPARHVHSRTKTVHFEGSVSGQVATAPRGDHGFGYDSIFEVDGVTFAELDAVRKNLRSHRTEAISKLRRFIVERVTCGV